jgi:hypothetical protein
MSPALIPIYIRGLKSAQGGRMITNFDHCTIVVRDIEKAREFFVLLGFREDFSTVISGDKFSVYMGVDRGQIFE